MTKFITQPVDVGGTTYVNVVPRKEGDPTALSQVRKFYSKIEDARRFEWQYRTAMAFREKPRHTCYWITLTYRLEPDSWELCRRDAALWIKRVKEYVRRVIVPVHKPVDPKVQYIIVEEEGELNGRKHFHVLIWMPTKLALSAWKRENMLKWRLGFVDVKQVAKGQALAIYIAKYAKKSGGRVKCSLKFGLMTTTLLLSLSSFRVLALVDLGMAQRLLRRLSLTPNYLTSARMNSLISSVRFPITSRETREVVARNPIGERSFWRRQISAIMLNRGILEGADTVSNTTATRVYVRSLVRQTAYDIRRLQSWQSLVCKTLYPHKSGVTAVERLSLVEEVFPGIASFGRPRPISRPPRVGKDQDPRVWYRKFKHPACARARARLDGSRVQSAGSAAGYVSPVVSQAADKEVLRGIRRGSSPSGADCSEAADDLESGR